MASIGGINWLEQARTEGPGDCQWSRDETRVVLVGDTDFANVLNGTAVKTILGFSARTGPGLINRLPPLQCPLDGFGQCYATKITSCKFWSPKGGDAAMSPKKTGAQGLPFTNYTTARLTVVFETLPYDILSNAQMTANGYTDEWYRWTLKMPYANVETIVRPGNSFAFAMGPSAGTIFPQGLVVRVQKRDLVVKWFQVPALSVLQLGQSGVPYVEPWAWEDQALANTVGFVNNATWHGYRRGEVLLKPTKVEPMAEPVPPAVLGLAPGAVPRCFNYEFHFLIFQPPYDPTELAAGHYVTFGHQTMPPVSAATNGYFYQGARGGAANLSNPKAWLYPEASFDQLFKSL